MGFGIALIGYLFMLMHEIGGSVIASVMLSYGFFLASRFNKTFVNASISALFLLPRGVYNLAASLGFIAEDGYPVFDTVSFYIYLAAWMVMSFFWLIAVAQIASDSKAEKLEKGARYRLIFTVCFLAGSLGLTVLSGMGMLGGFTAAHAGIQYILQYTVIIVNILFMHTCFVMITSAREYERDRQALAIERANALSEQHKQQQEEKARIEKRRNK